MDLPSLRGRSSKGLTPSLLTTAPVTITPRLWLSAAAPCLPATITAVPGWTGARQVHGNANQNALLAFCRRMVRDTGRLLSAFVWGSVATVAGSLLAFKLLPLRSLGADGWKVAAALTVCLHDTC